MLLFLLLKRPHILTLNTVLFYVNECGIDVIILRLPTCQLFLSIPFWWTLSLFSWGRWMARVAFILCCKKYSDLRIFINLHDYLLTMKSCIWTCRTPSYFQNKSSLFGSSWPFPYLPLQPHCSHSSLPSSLIGVFAVLPMHLVLFLS